MSSNKVEELVRKLHKERHQYGGDCMAAHDLYQSGTPPFPWGCKLEDSLRAAVEAGRQLGATEEREACVAEAAVFHKIGALWPHARDATPPKLGEELSRLTNNQAAPPPSPAPKRFCPHCTSKVGGVRFETGTCAAPEEPSGQVYCLCAAGRALREKELGR